MSSYPKEIIKNIPEIQVHNQCFFIIKMDDPYYDTLYEACKKTLKEKEIHCIRAAELLRSDTVMEDVIRGIKSSFIIVADISELNPNVLYELGIAHCIKDEGNVLLVCNHKKLPFDVHHLRFHLYDRQSPIAAQDIVDLIIGKFQKLTAGLCGNRVIGYQSAIEAELQAKKEVWVATHYIFTGPWSQTMAKNMKKKPPVKYKYVLPLPTKRNKLIKKIHAEYKNFISKYHLTAKELSSCIEIYPEAVSPPMEFFIIDPGTRHCKGFLTISDYAPFSDYTFVSVNKDQIEFIIKWFTAVFANRKKREKELNYPTFLEELKLNKILSKY